MQIERDSDLTPREGDQLKKAAVGESEGEGTAVKRRQQRLASSRIGMEEHLAGLWNVLGLGD